VPRTGSAGTGLVELPAGAVLRAVRHGTIEEIWYVLAGEGDLWRADDVREETVALAPGTCVTIPAGVSFQFRATGPDGLRLLMVTIPPWPGDHEANPVDGPWSPIVEPGG
jgi:mannose-6-phosphate isomerase-like protein (cupin superfamily)